MRRLDPRLQNAALAFLAGHRKRVFLIGFVDAFDLRFGARDDLLALGIHAKVAHRNRDARTRRVTESQIFHGVQQFDATLVALAFVGLEHQSADGFLVGGDVCELNRDRQNRVENQPPNGRDQTVGFARLDDLTFGVTHAHQLVQGGVAKVIGAHALVHVGVFGQTQLAHFFHGGDEFGVFGATLDHGQVETTQNHIVARRHRWSAIARRKQVGGAHHQDARLGLRWSEQRDVNRHLIAVEVGVERRTHQRVNLNCLALDQLRLERLNPQTVQGGGAVQQHRMLFDHFFQSVPNFRLQAVNHAARGLDVGGVALLHQPFHHERLEQFERHFFGQPALIQAQLRPDDDHRAARIIHALAQQVLAKTAFFALQHIRQRLERTPARTRDRTLTARVVDQSVHRFLQQPLLVVDDRFGRLDFGNALEPVVTIDNTTIQIVQVRSGETTAVQLNHRAQFGWHDRNDFHNHPFRAVLRFAERLDDFQTLDEAPALGAHGRFLHLLFQFARLGFEIDVFQQFLHGDCAHAGVKDGAKLFAQLDGQHFEQPLQAAIFQVGQQTLRLDFVEQTQSVLQLFFALFSVGVARHIFGVAARARQIVLRHALIARVNLSFGLGVDVDVALALHVARGIDFAQGFHHRVADRLDVFGDFGLIRARDDPVRKIQHALQKARRHIEQERHRRGHAFDIPEVSDGRGQFDVTHANAAHFTSCDFDAATVADHAFELGFLELAARAFHVLGRAKDALAKQAVAFGLEGAVVDGFGLLDFAPAPRVDVLGRSYADAKQVERGRACRLLNFGRVVAAARAENSGVWVAVGDGAFDLLGAKKIVISHDCCAFVKMGNSEISL